MRASIWVKFLCATVLVGLAGCAHQSTDAARASAEALKRRFPATVVDHPAAARAQVAAALRLQPQNGYLHLLNGLTYQLQSGSLQSLALAKVGYDAAVKFAPNHYWSHYLAGSVALQTSNYAEAAEHFSAAILQDPSRPAALIGLAVSRYLAGDLAVARAAAQEALALAPENPWAWRTALYVAAAGGERQRLQSLLAQAGNIPAVAQTIEPHRRRLENLLHTAALLQVQDANPYKPMQPQPWMIPPASAGAAGAARGGSLGASTGPAAGSAFNQVMIEVTLLLNQSQVDNNTGINLLDGLAVQFGAEYSTTDNIISGAPDTATRVLTSNVRIPDITYSLNLFNTRDDYYRVLARPSLVAYLDKPSEFFIGRQVNVGVSGINIGALQPVDVGTSVKITPSEITPQRTKFTVEVTRSFVTTNAGGTFQQSLTTFKQVVSATADVEFGKTLVLSGLYEGVDVGSSSKTPGIGDLPVLDTLFNSRTHTDRRDVALVLVTARLPALVQTGPREFRGETLKRLLTLWNNLIEPTSDIDAIIGAVGEHPRNSKLFRPKSGDVRLEPVSEPAMLKEVIAETIAQLN
jgi:tetratricopeptide (TPR) repeat protein